jgi:hypothetical protein
LGGGYYWWQRLHPALPPGILFGNGRLGADEINIDTRYATRILEILVDEGDLVKANRAAANTLIKSTPEPHDGNGSGLVPTDGFRLSSHRTLFALAAARLLLPALLSERGT